MSRTQTSSFGAIFGSGDNEEITPTLADDTYKGEVCNGSDGQSWPFIPNGLASKRGRLWRLFRQGTFRRLSSLFILGRIPLSKPRTISLSVTLHFTAQQAVRCSSTVRQRAFHRKLRRSERLSRGAWRPRL